MAVCGLPSILCLSLIQPDMDSCPSQSVGVTRNHLSSWQGGAGARASSCFSTTMVDHIDRDESGSSRPTTPTRAPSESKHLVKSLPRHELELSISSLNGAQRKSVKEEFDPTSASNVKEDLFEGSMGGQEETSYAGPRKRAKVNSLGFRSEESPNGPARDQLSRRASLSFSSDVTESAVHGLMPCRSLPLFSSTERERSGTRGVVGGSTPTTSWWLAPSPKSYASAKEALQFQAVQEAARANFSIDGRGIIPGSGRQEGNFLCKELSFFPNMLSNMESEHGRSGGGAAPPGSEERSQAPLDPPAHPIFGRNESSASRLSSTSTVSEETGPRSGTPFFSGSREAVSLDHSMVIGRQTQQKYEGERRRQPSTESLYGASDRERRQIGFTRPQQVEPRSQQIPVDWNANTTFYARILDAAQQSVPTTFNQAGLTGAAFNPSTAFNLAGQTLPRNTSQRGCGPIPFGGDAPSPSVQHVNSNVVRNLLVANPNMSYVPTFMSEGHPPDPVRLSFPNVTSLDFLQSLKWQGISQVTDKCRQPASGVGQVPGNHPSQSFHHSFSAEMNPGLPPRGSVTALQTSSEVRDFLPTKGNEGTSLAGLRRNLAIGPHGFSSAMQVYTNLSLNGPTQLPPLIVVMEGRPIGSRMGLQQYDGYESFAKAVRAIFDGHSSSQDRRGHGESCTLANAIPGFVIAYEDEEGDVLLAGDLPWRDFVREAKQIRIVSSSKISFKPPTGPSGP